MDLKNAIYSQYGAALDMLEQATVKCPEEMWDDAQDKNRFWQVAYHVLYYTHLYLQPGVESFRRWPKHREHTSRLESSGQLPQPYTQAEILEYLEFCRKQVNLQVPLLDLESASGFNWLPFDKLELQLYNIRHLQQHTGELMERLGARAGIDVDWVSYKK